MRTLLFIILLIFSHSSFALGKLGHQLVCQLAFDHLSTAKQQKITTLLNDMPNESKALINKYLYQPSDNKISFAKSCIWADAIKKDKSYDDYKPWHYVNISRKASHMKADSCKKDCVTQAINVHQQALKTEKNLWRKTQALMFLGHWLGDIHQPLHVSYASDWGGNKVKVNSPDKKCTSLHWLWDTCLITRENLSQQQWLSKLNNDWNNAPIAQWQNTRPWQWADESLQLVRQKNLGYCHIKNGECLQNSNQDNAQLYSPSYQKHFAEILEARMLQAAVRLTSLLEVSL